MPRQWQGAWGQSHLTTSWGKDSCGSCHGDSSSGSNRDSSSGSSGDSSGGSSGDSSGGSNRDNDRSWGNEGHHGLSIAQICLRILRHENSNKIINLGHLGQPGCLIGCSQEARQPLSVCVKSWGNDQQLRS
jgi:hypothetical protein